MVFCTGQLVAVDGANNKREQFLREYEKPEALLRKKYCRVEVRAIVTEKDTPTALAHWSKFRLVAAAKALRFDAERDHIKPVSGDGERRKSSIDTNPAKAAFISQSTRTSQL